MWKQSRLQCCYFSSKRTQYLEDNVLQIKHSRRQLQSFEELEVIAQIKLLQSTCNSNPVPKFLKWFHSQQYLTDEESYNVSREIEAAPESSPSTPKDRKFVVKCLSLLFHGTDVADTTPIKSSDQPKSPRSRSSGESMDSSSEVSSQSPIHPVDTVSSRVSSSLSSVSSSSSPSSRTPKVPRRSILAAVCIWIQKRSVRTTSGNWVLRCSPSVTACFSKVAFPGCRQKNGHDNIGIRQEDDDLYQSTLRASPKLTLETEPPENSQFTQAISQDRELVISEKANVFHAW